MNCEPLERRVLLSTAGSVDASFGAGGKTFFPTQQPLNLRTVGGGVQPDGKTVIVGASEGDYLSFQPIFARFNADGTPDARFGDDGVLFRSPTHRRPFASLIPTTAIVDGAGRIYVAGGDLVARFDPNGFPDYTFGFKGVTNVTFNVQALALTPDGTLLVGGSQYEVVPYPRSPTKYDFAVARLTPAGKLDLSFGQAGIATTSFRNRKAHLDATVHTLAVDSSGRILAGGGDNGFLDLVRFNADGSYDPTFGTGGGVRLRGGAGGGEPGNLSSGGPWFDALAIRPSDGEIFAGGGYQPPKYGQLNGPLFVSAFNAQGRSDTHFGNDGVLSATLTGDEDPVNAMITGLDPLPGGKLLVTGSSVETSPLNSPADGVLLARINPDGSPDSSFAPAVPFAPGTSAAALGLHLLPFRVAWQQADEPATSAPTFLPSGEFVLSVAGGQPADPYGDDVLNAVRFNSDGSTDGSFAADGIATAITSVAVSTYPTAVFAAADGSSVVQVNARGNPIYRLLPSGSIDSSFQLTTDGDATLLAVQPDGKLLVAETRAGAATGLLARYNADGSADLSFGDNGAVVLPTPGNIQNLQIAASGQIVFDVNVAATTEDPQSSDTLVSVSPAGVITGTFTLPTMPNSYFGGPYSTFIAFTLTPAGQVILINQVDADASVSRLNGTDLSVDSSFASIALDFGQFESAGQVTSLHALPDGGYLMVETVGGEASTLIRLTSAFHRDGSFGTNGIVTLPDSTRVDPGRLLLQADGKILLLEATTTPHDGDTDALVRLNADGSVDESFGINGTATAGEPQQIALQPTSDGESLLFTSGLPLPGYVDPNAAQAAPTTAFVSRLEL